MRIPTDRQEHRNHNLIVEKVFRCCVNYGHETWVEQCSTAEFAFGSAHVYSTGMMETIFVNVRRELDRPVHCSETNLTAVKE